MNSRSLDKAHAALLSRNGEYYDWQRMRRDALAKLRAGLDATFQPYDWDHNRLAPAELTVHAQPVVIVEGLFVSRPPLADLADVAVLVIADEKLRGARQRARRDASNDWLARWHAAQGWYFEHVRPPSTFDVVVDGA